MHHPGWEFVQGPPPAWHPHHAQPVILPAVRPARFRRRLVSDDYSRAPLFYHAHDGLMMPEEGAGLHRSRSTGHRAAAPAAPPVQVFNHIVHEDEPRGRPEHVVDEALWQLRAPPRSPFRDHSRPRPGRVPSRDHSPFYDWQHEVEAEQMRKELDELKMEKGRAAEEERIKKEMKMELAMKEQREREESAKRKEIEKEAIKAFKQKELQEKEKKRKEEEDKEKEYRQRLQQDLGLTETQVAKIVKKEGQNAVDLQRTTYTKIARRHVSLETLKLYGLPYKLDDVSPPDEFRAAAADACQGEPENYVLIKRWVPEYEQNLLWDHTRRLREDREYKIRGVVLKHASEEAKAKLILARKKPRARSPGLLDFFVPRR
ncbi:MAG: hypothetical protein M1832_004922 [Thelocarpon impressellum]|nr:MAG: hypothetical protein M1832_004922 [Thelocarpon impressellum]